MPAATICKFQPIHSSRSQEHPDGGLAAQALASEYVHNLLATQGHLYAFFPEAKAGARIRFELRFPGSRHPYVPSALRPRPRYATARLAMLLDISKWPIPKFTPELILLSSIPHEPRHTNPGVCASALGLAILSLKYSGGLF
jgi:hypothetical protein